MTQLDGKVALITGASRGIGAETAKVFAAAGAKVALAARSRDAVAELAAALGPETALALPCDVSQPAEVDAALSATEAAFGGLDILVNNAGVVQPIAHLAEATPDAWGHLIDINLKGVFYAMHGAIPRMLARGGGTILNISSGAANGPVEGWSAYCASKAGAKMLTAMGHKEYGARGLRVLGLSPGTVATEMQREIKASGVNPVSKLAWSDHIPADWPAKALLWMCGAAADPWLGQDISLRAPEIRDAVGLA